MEASKFIKESIRMCDNYHCDDCPAGFGSPCISDSTSLADDDKALEKYIAMVEKWSKEHPVKTNLSKFKDVFGDDITNVLKNYADGVISHKVFKDVFVSWLGKEYAEREK